MPRIEDIESLFHQALSLPPGPERVRWVEQHCQGDAELLAEVLSLLESNEAMERDDRIRPAQPLIPKARFGSYRAVELLAQGGMRVRDMKRMDRGVSFFGA